METPAESPAPPRPPLTPSLGGLGSFLLVAIVGPVASALVLWGFGELSLLDAVERIDHPILEYVAERRVAWVTDVMSSVTWIGSYEFTVGLGGAVGLWLLAVKRWWLAPVLLAAAWLEVLVVQNFLQDSWVVGSAPPDALALGPAGPYPSGGAARITVVVVLAAAFLIRAYGRRVGRWLWAGATLLVLLEVVSRIYLARHWVIDIVGGVLMGALLAGGLALAGSFLPRLGPGPGAPAVASRSRRRPSPGGSGPAGSRSRAA